MDGKIMFDVKLKILNKIVSDENNFFCSGGNQCDREKFLFRKLKEETDELSSLFCSGAGNIPKKAVINEAGDLFFVIASICDLYGLEWFDVAENGIEKYGNQIIEFAMNGKSFVFIIKGGEVIDYFCRE